MTALILAIAAALTVAFLISRQSRARARFSYRLEKARTTVDERTDGRYLVYEATVVVRNRSTDANSLDSLHLVSWLPGRKVTTRFNDSPVVITKEGEDIALSLLRFEAKTNHTLALRWEIRTDESPDALLNRSYEIVLQDSDERLFDQQGRLKNRRNIEQWLQFTESVRGVSEGGRPPLAATAVKLKAYDLVFLGQWLLWRSGF